MTGDLTKKLTVEFILEWRVLQTGVNEMLHGTEVMLERHRLHRSGEIELKMLEEILGLGIEGAGGKGGECLVETT